MQFQRIRHCIVGIAIVFSTPWTARADQISDKPFIGQPSTATYTVRIDVADVRLAVPRNYLELLNISPSTKAASFDIVVSWPNLSGATDETLRCFRSENWRSCDVVVIHQSVIGRARVRQIVALLTKPSSGETRFGLSKITAPELRPLTFWTNRGEDPEAERVVINCGFPGGPPTRNCEGFLPVSDELVLEYEYPLSRLAEWREIHDGVRRLIGEFQTDPTN